MVHDTSMLKTQLYKVWIKGKVEQSRARSSSLPYILAQSLSKRKLLGHSRLRSPTNIYIYIYIYIERERERETGRD